MVVVVTAAQRPGRAAARPRSGPVAAAGTAGPGVLTGARPVRY